MNEKQSTLLQVGIVVAVVMGIVPPWTDSRLLMDGHLAMQGAAGYSFILNPPKTEVLHIITLDVSRLVVQWVVVALATGCGVLYLRESSKQ